MLAQGLINAKPAYLKISALYFIDSGVLSIDLSLAKFKKFFKGSFFPKNSSKRQTLKSITIS